MTSISNDLPYDIDAPSYPPPDPYTVTQEAAMEAVRQFARAALENNPGEHRTGCTTQVLAVIAEVLVDEKGWTRRQVADALVLEAVRAGGNLERRPRP